jgi:hypothetical protein
MRSGLSRSAVRAHRSIVNEAYRCPSASREQLRFMTSKLPARSKGADTVGGAAGDRLDCQRRIDPADGLEHGTIADPEVADIPTWAIRVDSAIARVGTHARGAIETAKYRRSATICHRHRSPPSRATVPEPGPCAHPFAHNAALTVDQPTSPARVTAIR